MNCYSFVGNCPTCGRPYEYLNIRHEHWAYCDRCGIRECIGKDLFPSWRVETEAIWQANAERIRDYAEISPDHGSKK